MKKNKLTKIIAIMGCLSVLTGCSSLKASLSDDNSFKEYKNASETKSVLVCVYDDGTESIFVDRYKKVMYAYEHIGYGGGMSLLVNEDGSPRIFEGDLSDYD